jgi:hypothetical protein
MSTLDPRLPTSQTVQDSAASNLLDFSTFQFNDETFLEDILLCQFTYNPSGLTVPSTPTAPSALVTNMDEIPNNLLPQSGAEGSQRLTAGEDITSTSALVITADELELFHANLMTANGEGDLNHFKPPSLSRTLRCIVAYFRHFDPHAPIIHYASFKISTAHRQ